MKVLFLQAPEYLERYELSSGVNVMYLNGNYKVSSSDLKQYDLVVSCVNHDAVANFVIQKSRRNGIPTLMLTDGVFDLANSLNNGISNKAGVRPCFDNSAQFITSCTNLSDKVSRLSGADSIKYIPKFVFNQKDSKVSKGIDTQYALITTANSPYFSSSEYDLLLRLMTKLVDVLIKKKIRIKFRVFDVKLLNALTSKMDDDSYLVVNEGTFISSLDDVAACFSTHSSIVIPVVMSDIPLGCFLYRSEPVEPIAGWYLINDLDFSDIVDDMLNPDPDRLAFQKASIKDFKNKSIVDIHAELVEIPVTDDLTYDKLLKLLHSPFNINLQYFFYKFYLKIKGNKIIRKIRLLLVNGTGN